MRPLHGHLPDPTPPQAGIPSCPTSTSGFYSQVPQRYSGFIQRAGLFPGQMGSCRWAGRGWLARRQPPAVVCVVQDPDPRPWLGHSGHESCARREGRALTAVCPCGHLKSAQQGPGPGSPSVIVWIHPGVPPAPSDQCQRLPSLFMMLPSRAPWLVRDALLSGARTDRVWVWPGAGAAWWEGTGAHGRRESSLIHLLDIYRAGVLLWTQA